MVDRQTAVVEAVQESEHADLSRREITDELNIPYNTTVAATIALEERGVLEHTRNVGNVKMYAFDGGE